ncbi:substrate-binding domain-containing protein [Streptomyces griseus]|uniref:substrate-binding domain-containing protein n=1 Tax=Streptomyces griseus TaxID=1911 RepID=UPI00099B7596|nr:substrate-binding domain-containing protein [Streptomyces griseus]
MNRQGQRFSSCSSASHAWGSSRFLAPKQPSHPVRVTAHPHSFRTSREPPTAIFAEQDELAASVISTLRKARIEVPQRISVLGFDDQLMARTSAPAARKGRVRRPDPAKMSSRGAHMGDGASGAAAISAGLQE